MKESSDKAWLAVKRGRWDNEMYKPTEHVKRYQRGDL